MNQTICPTGFVIPEHPDDHRVQYVDLTITECAFSCVSHPRYTPEEYAWVFIVRFWSSIFSGFLALAAVGLWCTDRKNMRHNFFVIVYGINMVVAAFVLTLVFFPGPEERFCVDNATPIYDNPEPTCSIEGFWLAFCFGVMCVCWCCQSYVLYDRIVLGTRPEHARTVEYLPWIIGLPLLSTLVLAGVESFVYELGRVNCDLWGKHPELDFFFGWLLDIVAVFLGIFFVCTITWKIAMLYRTRSQTKEGNSNLWKVVKLFSTALKYMFAFGFYLGSLMVVAVVLGVGDGDTSDEQLDRTWALCVFQHFDGVSDSSFLPQCGRTPERNLSFETLCFLQFYTFGMHGLLFIGVYWDPLKDIYLKTFWSKLHQPKVAAFHDVGELPPSASSSVPEELRNAGSPHCKSPGIAPTDLDMNKYVDMPTLPGTVLGTGVTSLGTLGTVPARTGVVVPPKSHSESDESGVCIGRPRLYDSSQNKNDLSSLNASFVRRVRNEVSDYEVLGLE